jgi:quercetin dioxygenase-like cupin family protein
MRPASVVLGVSTILLCGCTTAPPTPKSQPTSTPPSTPLILEKDEGERRVVRPWPGHPDPGESFILKVDPKNGGSSHLVFFTANLAAGGEIHAHRHPNSDEILYLQSGTARVHLGDSVRDVHAGATVYIPAGTWISVSNVGKEGVSLVTIFSAPGFENFMRESSVREGEQNLPMSEAENDQLEKSHSGDVIYREP